MYHQQYIALRGNSGAAAGAALNTQRRGGNCLEPHRRNHLAAIVAPAVCAFVKFLEGSIDV
jgi:hypothetical protein